jgi:hypothetical protein
MDVVYEGRLPESAVQAISRAVSAEVVDEITERVLRRARAEGITVGSDGFLSSEGAADYLGVKRKRIYDLKSMGALEPDGFDGRTPLYRKVSLDHYASDSG